MKVIQKDIAISAENPHCLVLIGDIHMGHADHDEDFARKTIAWIKKKGASVILLGDLIDGIAPQDRRFENSSIADNFKIHLDNLHAKQVEKVVELLDPISGQIISTMSGNHEDTVKKHFSYDAAQNIADQLKVPLLTDPGYVVLRFKMGTSIMLKSILCSHGHFMGGRLRGGKVNAMERLPASFAADIYAAGHTHDLWVTKKSPIGLTRNGNLETRKIYFINTGSMMNTYPESDVSTWASRKLFDPIAPGVARIDFYIKRTDTQSKYIDVHVRT